MISIIAPSRAPLVQGTGRAVTSQSEQSYLELGRGEPIPGLRPSDHLTSTAGRSLAIWLPDITTAVTGIIAETANNRSRLRTASNCTETMPRLRSHEQGSYDCRM
jgi:hypothetical protein